MELIKTDEGLTLTDGKLSLCHDFADQIKRIKQPGGLSKEMLIRAVRIKGIDRPLRIVDATAGLGEDSFLLAAAGHFVTMFEYNPVICELLKDALLRGRENSEISDVVARMKLVEGDFIESRNLDSEISNGENLIEYQNSDSKILENEDLIESKNLDTIKPDVVYLDPMFPERKKSGLIKKKFQLLQKLERPCGNEAELFGAAVKSGAKRIVVKRPIKAKEIAGKRPGFVICGSVVRYDCYVL